MKAVWKGKVVAQSEATVVVESNHYFPRESLGEKCFTESETTSHCAWKGEAKYLSIVVGGETNKDAAWYYPKPKNAAKEIEGKVAFWRGVQITE